MTLTMCPGLHQTLTASQNLFVSLDRELPMIRRMKRSAGALIILVGAIGAVFSGYAIREIWLTAEQLRAVIPKAIGELETAGQSIHHQGEAAGNVLQTTRNRLNSILETVEALSENRTDRQVVTVLNRLDAEVVERLERAEEFVRSMQSSVESAGRAALLLESVPFLRPRVSSTTVGEESHLTTLASSLTQISEGLGQMKRILTEIRTSRNVDPANLVQFTDILQGVDEQLLRIQRDIDSFSTEINTLLVRLAEARSHSGYLIKRMAIFGSVFFVCFGISQLHLLVHGWRYLSSGTPATGTEESASAATDASRTDR